VSDIGRYLTDVYRRDILGESLEVAIPAVDVAEVKARIKEIDDLGLRDYLQQRDFVSFQNRRALVKLLARLEMRGAADSQGQ